MAIAMLVEFPGGTQQQYEQIGARLRQRRADLPSGIIFHAGGPADGGWRVVELWESQDAFDSFLDAHLRDVLREVGASPPQITVWPVHTYFTGAER